MSDHKDRDKKYKEALSTKRVEVKLNFALERLQTIEDRLDNGISEAVYRNSWAVGIFGTAIMGLTVAIISGAV